MDDMLLLFVAGAGAAVVLAVVAVGLLMNTRNTHDALQDKLTRWAGRDVRRKGPLARIADLLEDSAMGRRIARDLSRAGLQWRVHQVILGRLVLSVGGTYLLARLFGLPELASLGVLMVLEWVLWRWLLRMRRSGFLVKFNKQLPEICRLLGSGLAAGFTVHQGITLLAKELSAPGGPAFRRLEQELRLGVTLDKALENLADRVGSDELALFTSTIQLHRAVGGNLAGALENLAQTLIERDQVRGEVRGASAEARFIAILLPCMPIFAALILNLIIPNFMRALFTTWGAMLFCVFAAMQIMAFLIIRRITAIEV